MGYTGKNTSFAIIDTGTICKNGKQHNALNFKEYYIPDAEKNPDGKTKHDLDNFHGQATSYIAQEIAPQADLYYYAQSNTGNNENVLAENLQAIINKNKTLPDNKKIRVVSMSFSFNQDNPKILEKVKELEKQGVWVFSAQEFEKDFNCCEKKDPTGDINDFNNYQMYYYEKNENGSLYINSGNRTVPDPESPDTFRHDYVGSISWGVPVVAGYYTLACQADTSMTPQKFKELASKTARIIESTNPVVNNCFLNIGRTKETTKIKMIDIKALLQAIEQEKINSNSLF